MSAPQPLTVDERIIRLNELDSLSASLLLHYLDGRAPGLIDEWFASRETRKARAVSERA